MAQELRGISNGPSQNDDGQLRLQIQEMGMKELWRTFMYLLDTFGRMRAASELARQGKHEEALRLMDADREVHP
jgi:hypothetical protein